MRPHSKLSVSKVVNINLNPPSGNKKKTRLVEIVKTRVVEIVKTRVVEIVKTRVVEILKTRVVEIV